MQIGYKQFFGDSKIVGLRYYGFFSGQGGSGSYTTQLYDENGNPYTAKVNQPAANLFYGVGADFLYNFYENSDQTYGAFVGVMVGGSSWLMGETKANGKCLNTSASGKCQSLNEFNKASAADLHSGGGNQGSDLTFSPTYVQFLFNIGFRMNFSKHQGFEFGVRIPTIDDPYVKFTATKNQGVLKKGDYVSQTLRRTVGVFANYVINF
ncbi:outer membrane protein [Helicobacter felis]|uniref:outer membrane protein n=1 Tax=Helicobacter felis TaxID=214 RepID=UPI001F298017|nr:outer membrane protein [Helicobacter felis]